MRESDALLYRAIRRDEAVSNAGDETSHNAALCGARRILPGLVIRDEEPAGEELALEQAGSLSVRQSRVAVMLAEGMSVAEVAAITGLHRGTIFRWRQHSSAFRNAQRSHADQAASELGTIARRLLVKATGFIERDMEDHSDGGTWSARIIRNRRLWEIALAETEKTKPGE